MPAEGGRTCWGTAHAEPRREDALLRGRHAATGRLEAGHRRLGWAVGERPCGVGARDDWVLAEEYKDLGRSARGEEDSGASLEVGVSRGSVVRPYRAVGGVHGVRRVRKEISKVVPLGGGALGWVDLHLSILVCDLLDLELNPSAGEDPVELTRRNRRG